MSKTKSPQDLFVNECTRRARKLVDANRYVRVCFYTEQPLPNGVPYGAPVLSFEYEQPLPTDDANLLAAHILEQEKRLAKQARRIVLLEQQIKAGEKK